MVGSRDDRHGGRIDSLQHGQVKGCRVRPVQINPVIVVPALFCHLRWVGGGNNTEAKILMRATKYFQSPQLF